MRRLLGLDLVNGGPSVLHQLYNKSQSITYGPICDGGGGGTCTEFLWGVKWTISEQKMSHISEIRVYTVQDLFKTVKADVILDYTVHAFMSFIIV